MHRGLAAVFGTVSPRMLGWSNKSQVNLRVNITVISAATKHKVMSSWRLYFGNHYLHHKAILAVNTQVSSEACKTVWSKNRHSREQVFPPLFSEVANNVPRTCDMGHFVEVIHSSLMYCAQLRSTLANRCWEEKALVCSQSHHIYTCKYSGKSDKFPWKQATASLVHLQSCYCSRLKKLHCWTCAETHAQILLKVFAMLPDVFRSIKATFSSQLCKSSCTQAATSTLRKLDPLLIEISRALVAPTSSIQPD